MIAVLVLDVSYGKIVPFEHAFEDVEIKHKGDLNEIYKSGARGLYEKDIVTTAIANMPIVLFVCPLLWEDVGYLKPINIFLIDDLCAPFNG